MKPTRNPHNFGWMSSMPPGINSTHHLMKNPWLSMSWTKGPYVFDRDRRKLDEYNLSVLDPRARVILDVIPEPFIGNPNSAQVVLLGLNPGYSASDPAWHAREDFRKSLFLNLGHKLQDYPFYPLNPAFAESGAGRWWRKRTSQLRETLKKSDWMTKRLPRGLWSSNGSRITPLSLKWQRINTSRRNTLSSSRWRCCRKSSSFACDRNHFGRVLTSDSESSHLS
jgi:hypothetical protein